MQSLGSRAVLVRGTLLGCMVCAFVIAAAPAALAQSVTAGSIRGKVTDETGAALPGVTVTVTGPGAAVAGRTSVTDGDGEYRFTDLPVGDYKLTLRAGRLPGVHSRRHRTERQLHRDHQRGNEDRGRWEETGGRIRPEPRWWT